MIKVKAMLITDFLSAAAALALLLAAIILHSSSTGYIKKGGDEDSGSGLGGTGKSLLGVSTPAIIPFIGVDQNTDEVMIIAQSSDLKASIKPLDYAPELFGKSVNTVTTSVRPPVELVVEPGATSEAISVIQTIQYAINAKALLYEFPELAVTEKRSDIGKLSTDRLSMTTSLQPGNAQTSESWLALKQLLASEAKNGESAVVDSLTEDSGSSIRSREDFRLIQRPSLPPVQRVRPIERISVLPPRVLPMRI